MIKFRSVSFVFLFGAILFSPAVGPGPAASPSDIRPQVPSGSSQKVDVFFKLVQAYVVDKKGNPVSDLTAADFEISDNGKARKVEQFEVHALAAAPDPTSAPAQPAGEPKPVPSVPSLSRKYFFVFNYAFIDAGGIPKARKAALDFLDNYVHPTDEVGIVSLSATKGVQINEFLTRDHARIRTMIQGNETGSYSGRAEQIANMYQRNISQYLDVEPNRRLMSPAGVDGAPPDEAYKEIIRRLASEEAKMRAANYNQAVAVFFGNLRSLARGFRFIPGNKNLLLFSSGISSASLFGAASIAAPENMGDEQSIIKEGQTREAREGDSRLRELFQTVNDDLRAANCPVYSFNVSGAQITNDVENFSNPLEMKVRDSVGNDSLKVMSSQTGGQYYHYTMDPKVAVQQFQKTTNTFYVLGFSIPAVYDGKFHKIKIKVNRKGCEVFGEGGYYNPKPFAEYSEFDKFIRVLELAEGRTPYLQTGIDFSLAAYSVPVKDKVAVALYAALPAERFKALGEGPAEVVTILFNAGNKLSVFKKTPLYVAALTKDTIFFDQALGLPPGVYDCCLVVRSLETGRGTSATTKVVIPAEAKAPGLTLYQANIFAPGSRPRYQGESGALAALYPFVVNGVPVITGLAKEAGKLLAVLPCATAGIENPDIAVTISLVDVRTTRVTPLEFTILNRYGSANGVAILAEINVPTLESGPYSLIIEADEKTTGIKARTKTEFVIL